MPIDAFLFGGRRATVVPLVYEAFDWEHGVFLGATMSVETTAAAAGEVGKLRFDPMAMLPFCGYNMADYFAHWLTIGREHETAKLPRIFVVNWFRKDDDGKFIWPGFGENIRVLEWVFRRCDGEGETVETPIGLVPARGRAQHRGRSTSPRSRCASCSRSTRAVVREQLPQVREFLAKFGDDLPAEIRSQLEALESGSDELAGQALNATRGPEAPRRDDLS